MNSLNGLINLNKRDKNYYIALDSIEKFGFYTSEGNIGRACAHLLVALKLMPDLKNDMVAVFATALREWGEVLADQKKFKDLFRGYDLALQVYPDNRFVINHLGEFHYRAGDFPKAHFYFKKACSMSPTECVESEKNLEMCKSAMVDRWHFRMLNDSHRNEAYREAITKKIKQGFSRVLDIGTGSGLLSLIASELCYETSGAGPVFACEENFTMINIAKNIQRRNLFVTMKLFHSHSSKLFLEHLHDKRVSLVVTEIMDAGLFGEGVLQTLNDAWRRFLLPPLPTQECSSCCDEEKPGVCMICNDQKLSPELRLSPRVNGMVVPLGATVWLAAIESAHVARQHRSLSSILRHNIETPFLFVNNSHEPYDSENLQSFPNAFKLLCKPIKCFFVNFNDPNQLLSFYNGQFDHDLHKIQFTTEGSLDAFVVWFDLHVDEDIKISTSPFDENAATCCWDQAIFPVHSELRVVAGSSAQLKVQTMKGILIVKLWEIENHIPSKSNYEDIPVSQEFIKFFNNSEYLDHLAIYSQTMACPGATILDLCPFPLVGLMRLKEDEESSLYFIAKCKDDKLAVERIAEVNDIDPSRIVFGEECDVNDDDDDFMMRSKYDVVVTNLISQEGEMSPTSIYHLSLCKNFLSDYGRIIPQGVTVWGQLISSEALTRSTEVIEQGIVEKYHIPKYMNEFKVQHVIDINSQILSHTALSEPFQIGHIDTFDIALQKRLQLKKSVVANKEGTASALLQWFQYEIDLPGCGPLKYSTRSIGSHVNQMCVLMEKQELKPKQVVKVNCEYYHGGLIIKFESQ